MKKFMIFIFASMCILPGLASASLQEDGAGVLVDLGKKYYDRGDAQEAIHEFSKALLVDPNNKEAKAYLAKYGLSQGLYKPLRTKETPIAELATQVQSYSQKMETLQQDKVAYDTTFDKLKQKNSALLDENQLKDQKIAELENKMDALSKTNAAHASKDMARNMEAKKEQMAKNDIGWEKERLPRAVQNIENQLAKAQRESVAQDIALVKMNKNVLSQIDRTINAQAHLVDTKQRYVAHLNNAIEAQPTVSVTSDPLLKQQLAEAQDRVSEQNKILSEQYENIKSLQGNLQEADDQVDRLLDMKK